jgi:L-ornithine N5-oxygenase
VAGLSKQLPYRGTVIGGAQSAAEMFRALHDDLPHSDIAWVMRSIGPTAYETGKFTNELYYPSFVDRFFEARPEGREQILREMHQTNYSGIAPALLESLYGEFYLDRLTNQNRKRLMTMVNVTAAREVADEVVLELTDRRTGAVTELHRDLVFLGTGFTRQMPALVQGLGAALGLDRIEVSRQYRMVLSEPSAAACYLQGVNEATHGIADSLLSVLADRAADTVRDVLTRRSTVNGHAPASSCVSLSSIPALAEGGLA